MARFYVFLFRKRSLVLAAAILGAALSAKGDLHVHSLGFFDGPG